MKKHHFFVQIEEIYRGGSNKFHDRVIYCTAHELSTELAFAKKQYEEFGAVIRQVVKLD